jgi:hypothetical protein
MSNQICQIRTYTKQYNTSNKTTLLFKEILTYTCICQLAHSRVQLLNLVRCSPGKWVCLYPGALLNGSKHLYLASVRSHLTYASPVWSPQTVSSVVNWKIFKRGQLNSSWLYVLKLTLAINQDSWL